MTESIRVAFEKQVVVLQTKSIDRLRLVSDATKKTVRYRRIARSVVEVGIIEPLIVARLREPSDRYLLLDGHLRLAALIDLNLTEVRCLIADDDEAYTYNKRVSQLSTIQEHFMLVRALEQGVSEERLSKALNVDVRGIRRRKTMLDGICPEVVKLLSDKAVSPATFEVLQGMKTSRQIESAELMMLAQNLTATYAKALLVATRQSDLVRPNKPKRMKGLTPEEMSRMEDEMNVLQRDLKAVEASLGDDVLHLVIAAGYLVKLIKNSEIKDYLFRHQPEILEGFEEIASSSSLSTTRPLNVSPKLGAALVN